jgi:hypothetical protein
VRASFENFLLFLDHDLARYSRVVWVVVPLNTGVLNELEVDSCVFVFLFVLLFWRFGSM